MTLLACLACLLFGLAAGVAVIRPARLDQAWQDGWDAACHDHNEDNHHQGAQQ